MFRHLTLSFLTLLVLSALPVHGAGPAADFASCETRFAAAPDAQESAQCFYDLGFNTPFAGEAETRMLRLLSRHPDKPWLALYLGHLLVREPERARPLYVQAADACAAHRLARCEVIARSNLQRILDDQGETEAAGRQAERAEQVAERSGEAELIARSKVVRARHLFWLGQDLERVYLLLRRAEEFAFPDGPYALQRECLVWLGNVSLELGQTREATGYFQRLADRTAREQDPFAESSARYNLARTLVDGNAEMPRPGYRQEAIALARRALAKAEEGENTTIQAKSHWLLGLLLTGEEAHRHLDSCLRVADNLRDRSYCLNALSRHLAEEDPRRARAASQEALALAHEAGDPWGIAYAWRERMRASWVSGSRAQAIADSRAALEAIEGLRDLQGGSASRVGLFSSWSENYTWFSGRVLETWRGDGNAAHLEFAFDTSERMRARALLDALNAAQAAPALPAAVRPLQQRITTVHKEISQVQRRLLDPTLPAGERAAAQAGLERLELEENDLRDRILEASPALSALRAPAFASLAQVHAALAQDEALLSFQIAPDQDLFGDFAGGSWLLVSTRQGTRAYRLRRDRVVLRSSVELFNGLFTRRDGSEAGPAASLYRDLLADALRDLPAGVRRLVLIPDDALHQLPFAALRAAADAPPLIERYEISLVPSATLWLHWGKRRPALPGAPLLALADPVPPGGEKGGWLGGPPQAAVARERAAMFGEAVRLGSLPYARREGRSAVRQLGGRSLLRVGDAASEGFLKSADLRQFGILHFATHAVLDNQNPERSGVLLTPAPESEDGLLQMREIVPLALDGRIVVLSSCRSASGTVLRGEGVMGIARAFFQAGAQTVIASLWPLRDDDGAALFDRFYHHLAQGKSVSAALRAAQLDRIAAGAPAYAWSGLVVLGEGDLVPMPNGRPSRLAAPWLWAGSATALLAVAGALLWRRRKIFSVRVPAR